MIWFALYMIAKQRNSEVGVVLEAASQQRQQELFVGEAPVLGHGAGTPVTPAEADVLFGQVSRLAQVRNVPWGRLGPHLNLWRFL